MLLQLLFEHPEAALTILHRTPLWVWGLLAGLVAMGLSQWRDREIGLLRAVIPSMGLTVFSIISLAGELRQTAWMGPALFLWLMAVGTVFLVGASRPAHTGIRYNPATQRFFLPGSGATLLTVLTIFSLKYGVGVELAMQPELRHSAAFALTLAVVYGAISGLFALRPVALWRLARPPIAHRAPADSNPAL